MFNTRIFNNLENATLHRRYIPAPKAALGSKTKTNEKIGIEVELEKVRIEPGNRTVPYWSTTTDGSLKVNGVEFIICCYSNKAKQAIKILKDSLVNSDCSQRTSVHVHLNVDNMNPLQLFFDRYATPACPEELTSPVLH